MKSKFNVTLLAILAGIFYTGISFAGDKEKMVVKLKTDDFEMAETDISSLEIGESETIVTESGKTIDLLRTAEGVDIFVDGELLEMPHMDELSADGSGHKFHKRIEIDCEVHGDDEMEAECGENMFFMADGDIDIEALHADGDAHKIIVKRMHSECESDDEGECDDLKVWVTDGEDIDLSELHEVSEGHKMIRIHKSHGDGDVKVHSENEKVIVVKKKKD
jgi:hypothetical protein